MNTAALKVAKRQQDDSRDIIHVLSTGVRARIVPVAAYLINEAIASVPVPEVPIWHDPDKDRDMPNPGDPAYTAALQRMNIEQANAANDALLIFGLILVDGLPQDETWITQLKQLAKRKRINLDGFELGDPLDKEFLYKRFVAVGASDMRLLGQAAGIKAEDVDVAVRSFRSDGEGGADPGSELPEPA